MGPTGTRLAMSSKAARTSLKAYRRVSPCALGNHAGSRKPDYCTHGLATFL